MKKISFNVEDGDFLLENISIGQLNEIDFFKKTRESNIEIEKNQTNTHIHNLSTIGAINEFEFGINFTFENAKMKMIWLTWDGGNTKKYGYNTTENQLIFYKNSLSTLLEKILNKSPDESKKTSSIFKFPWGHILACASLQSTMVTISISWIN